MQLGSKSNLSTRSSPFGNLKIYLAVVCPYLLLSFVCIFCAGMSHSAYVIAARIGFSYWAATFLLLLRLNIFYGVKNIKILMAIGDMLNTRQQLVIHVGLFLIELVVPTFLLLLVIFISSIDSSSTLSILIWSAFRGIVFLGYAGVSIYTWLSTTQWLTSSSVRKTGITGSHSKTFSKVFLQLCCSWQG